MSTTPAAPTIDEQIEYMTVRCDEPRDPRASNEAIEAAILATLRSRPNEGMAVALANARATIELIYSASTPSYCEGANADSVEAVREIAGRWLNANPAALPAAVAPAIASQVGTK